jgi:tripartite-type tricarboxylate transporter receptor subunit TctC
MKPHNPLHSPRMKLTYLAASAVLALTATLSHAQAWPTKPVRLVVAGPAGGSADLVARIVSDALTKELGQPVIVDPKPGAGGSIAVADLLQSPHDGQTLLVAVNSVASEVPHIMKLRWDPLKELKPQAELARGGLVLIAHPAFPAKDVKELVAYAKTKPNTISYASYSPGTMSHVLGLVLNQAAGIELVHVPYKGSTPALTDVMGGHVPLMFDGVATSLPMIRGGKLKPLAVSTPRRMPQLPDVPTFRELGYPQMDAIGWMGLWTTPDVPVATQARIRDSVMKVLADPAVRARMLETGFDNGAGGTPEELQKNLRADSERVGRVLKAIGFTPE